MYEEASGTPKEKINEMRRKLYAEKNGLEVDDEGYAIRNSSFDLKKNKNNSQRKVITANNIESNKLADTIEVEDFVIYKSVGAKARNYEIKDNESGEIFHFAEGSKIQDAAVFAGKDVKKKLRQEVAEGLAKQIGGTAEKWQHCKGYGIIDCYGEERKAEVHWFQEETVGKHKFKIKRWIDES